MHPIRTLLATALALSATTTAGAADAGVESAVRGAQARWCTALVEVGRAQTDGGDVAAAAARLLDTLYDFRDEPGADDVLFKPTLAHGVHTFRNDRRGALAYFIGGYPDYPEDRGFARRPWQRCEPHLAGVVEAGPAVVAMGKVQLVAADGAEVYVDKTFVYRRAADGLRLIAHMSALPYQPPGADD